VSNLCIYAVSYAHRQDPSAGFARVGRSEAWNRGIEAGVARRPLGGAQGHVDGLAGGFLAIANRIAKPGFVNAARGDFRLRPGSRCAGMGPQ